MFYLDCSTVKQQRVAFVNVNYPLPICEPFVLPGNKWASGSVNAMAANQPAAYWPDHREQFGVQRYRQEEAAIETANRGIFGLRHSTI